MFSAFLNFLFYLISQMSLYYQFNLASVIDQNYFVFTVHMEIQNAKKNYNCVFIMEIYFLCYF
jgi:hypothetical protein